MNHKLSLVVIAYNSEKTIQKTFASVRGIADEIILVDNYSTDNTVVIAKRYQAKIFYYKGKNRGIQCQMGIDKAKKNWILILDSDEELTNELKEEIKKKVLNDKKNIYDGYYLPFQPFYFGRPLKYGGEYYKKLILFKKNKGKILPLPIHYVCQIDSGKIGVLKNKVNHYSYRNLLEIYKKFTTYAIEEARLKLANGEKTSLKKIILYPLHMFYARFIEDKGYKDGWWRIPLDLGFAYMEFLTYFLLLIPWVISTKKEK